MKLKDEADLLTPFWCEWWKKVICGILDKEQLTGLNSTHKESFILLCDQAKKYYEEKNGK